MEFGLDKYAKVTFKWKLISSENIILDVGTVIKVLIQEGTYKYLGVNARNGIQHSEIKEKNQKGVHQVSSNENWNEFEIYNNG